MTKLSISGGDRVDRFGQRDIALGDPARVMAGEAEIDPVPHAGKLGVVINRFGMRSDAGEERERLREVIEFETFDERLSAVRLRVPTLWYWRRAGP